MINYVTGFKWFYGKSSMQTDSIPNTQSGNILYLQGKALTGIITNGQYSYTLFTIIKIKTDKLRRMRP